MNHKTLLRHVMFAGTESDVEYNKLPDHVRTHINLPLIYHILTEEYD